MLKLFFSDILKTKLLGYVAYVAIAPLAFELHYTTILLGLLTVSLIEYVMHRYLFHVLPVLLGKRLSKQARRVLTHGHIYHHKSPTQKPDLFLPLWMSLPTIGVLSLGVWALTENPIAAFSMSFGLALGYIFYEFMHLAAHHGTSNVGYFAFMRDWHSRHHVRNGGMCYGVTSPVWDYIFGSYLRKGAG